jgi:hypothetical protein
VAPKPTLSQALSAGIAPLTAKVSGGAATWTAVTGAATYVLAVTRGSQIVWTWAGSASGARLGDTALEGVAGSGDDAAPAIDATGATWTVLALDAKGRIVGAAFRVKGS